MSIALVDRRIYPPPEYKFNFTVNQNTEPLDGLVANEGD